LWWRTLSIATKHKLNSPIHNRSFISLSVKKKLSYWIVYYLKNLFSSVAGVTLEQYIIRQKIEKVKELLFYDELNLSEIADKLGYSSVAHLSGQFKKITGLTPSEMKKSRDIDQNRKPLDSVS